MSLLGKEILKNAEKLGISSLNTFQTQGLSKILSNKNTFLMGEPGIGKTSTFLFGISSIVSLTPCERPSNFTISNLFTKSLKPVFKSRPHGSLIILQSFDKLFEVYKKMRILAPWLNIKRTESSLSHFIGGFILRPDSNSDSDEIINEGFINSIQGVEWPWTDILLSTPDSLIKFMELRQGLNMSGINPALIVIDELDLLLQSSEKCKNLKNSFDFIEDCKDKQFVLTSNILPYFEISPNPLGILKKEFNNIEVVSSENWNKIRDDLKFEFYICSEENTKMQILSNILNNKQKSIVFSNYFSRCGDIKNLCDQIGLEGVLISSNLAHEDRIWNYFSRNEDHHVIISNIMNSRGFDIQVDHGIFYNLPSSIPSLVSQLGAIKKSGTVSILLENQEKKFQEIFKSGESLTSLLQFYSQSKTRKVHSLIPE